MPARKQPKRPSDCDPAAVSAAHDTLKGALGAKARTLKAVQLRLQRDKKTWKIHEQQVGRTIDQFAEAHDGFGKLADGRIRAVVEAGDAAE